MSLNPFPAPGASSADYDIDAFSSGGGTTIYGDGNALDASVGSTMKGKARVANNIPLEVAAPVGSSKFAQSAVDYTPKNDSLFIRIGTDGVLGALHKLDEALQTEHHMSILSDRHPVSWTGYEIQAGEIGLINHGGLPEIITKAGRYPRFPLRLWWARDFEGTKGLTDTVIEFQGLTIVQVSQNQAAVICDPQNQVFIVRNGGFVAFAIEGAYRVLGIVDQTHLPTPYTDRITGAILGYTHQVKMQSSLGSATEEYVAALFLDIPANNCVILQRGDDLELVGAGQHCITNPNVTLRGIFTTGENQIEMPTKDIFTRDQVPVSLTIYLKWQLMEPLKLTTHGYNNPYEALRDKAQSILTQIVAHLDYSSMVKQRSIGPDNLQEDGNDSSAAFLDALKTRAMDDLLVAATDYGIVLKDLAVIDRQFKGDIAQTMDKLTTRALQAQVEAANVDRENSNKVKQEEGALSVARVKAQQTQTEADARAYAVVAKAKADAEALRIRAQAEAEATRIAANAEADAIGVKAQAGEQVHDDFAREMELRRIEVQRVGAYGNRTVFVGEGTGAGGVGSGVVQGYASYKGMEQAQADSAAAAAASKPNA
ncbi:band 7 domain-containing protein [Clavulina sp. PMI_390]|nr:band 7 domain-containing protein [Clavulina sp. PMI_390]